MWILCVCLQTSRMPRASQIDTVDVHYHLIKLVSGVWKAQATVYNARVNGTNVRIQLSASVLLFQITPQVLVLLPVSHAISSLNWENKCILNSQENAGHLQFAFSC